MPEPDSKISDVTAEVAAKLSGGPATEERDKRIIAQFGVRCWNAGHADATAAFEADRQALQAELREALDIIDCLASSDQCVLDHHGYCQEHYWFETTECPHARARRIIQTNDAQPDRTGGDSDATKP